MTDYNTIYSLFDKQTNENLSFHWLISLLRLHFKKGIIGFLLNFIALIVFIGIIDNYYSHFYEYINRYSFILSLINIILLMNYSKEITLFLLILMGYKPVNFYLDSKSVSNSYEKINNKGKNPQMVYFLLYILISIFIALVLVFMKIEMFYIVSLIPIFLYGMIPYVIIPYFLAKDEFWIIYTNSIINNYKKNER